VSAFTAEIPIRFSDIDGFDHVNHTKYLTYCEDHRTIMFTQMGEETGSWLNVSGFSVASLECQYRRPLELADRVVEVRGNVEKIGTSSVQLGYELLANGGVVANVRTTIVLTEAMRPRPVTSSEREWLMKFIATGKEVP
jgi:acyl-CoA thioester hydrolase